MEKANVPDIASIGKMLIIMGLAIVVVGILVMLAARLPGVGRLPGDILIRRDGIVFYFPLISCLILSIVLTIIVNVIVRLTR